LMALELQIVLAFFVDQLLGDPRVFPHPVKWIGTLAAYTEGILRRCGNLRLAGILTVVVVLAVVGAAVFTLLQMTAAIPWLQTLLSITILYTTIAARDLVRHSMRVYGALAKGDLVLARRQVAMIVGRDTATLDEGGVARACVESVAENLVDGVTAPLFWAVVAGPMGAMLYKAVNTMDSMFGYKNERYLQFGWAAARLDDLANALPARITAFLVMAAAGVLQLSMEQSFRIWRRDRGNHASPNSGQSEAAVAGALGIQLGGNAIYFGQMVAKPTIGDRRQPISAVHIRQANRVMLVSAILAVVVFIAARMAVVKLGL